MKKYEAATTGATHAEVDCTLLEAANPFGPPVDTTGQLIRSAVVGGAVAVIQSKRLADSWLA